jgi:hypothetical protein
MRPDEMNKKPIAEEIWADDALGRKQLMQNWAKRLAGARTPLCVAVEGRYGSGKSYMFTRWHRENKQNGIPSIYFNAWENEFADDPLTSFMSQILMDHRNDAGIVEKVKGAVMKAGGVLATRALPIAAKGIAGKLFGGEAVAEILKTLSIDSDDIATELAGFAEDRLAAHVAARESSREFRHAFAKLITDLGGESGKVVIFVDELDRCRPTYAVSFLENIRHLLTVQGCTFLIGVDSSQMETTIRSVYGNETDAGGYLRKFFDWRVELPRSAAHAFAKRLIDLRLVLAHFPEGDIPFQQNGFQPMLRSQLTCSIFS